MPLDVKFDEDTRLIHVIVSGTWPTLPEIVEERSRLILAGYIRPGVVELVDTRGVTRGIPNLSQMQAILQSIGKPPDKRAIVVGSNVQFGAGRIAETLDPKGIKVFRDEDSARKYCSYMFLVTSSKSGSVKYQNQTEPDSEPVTSNP